MRYSIIFLLFLSLLFVGCKDEAENYLRFSIYNRTDHQVRIDTNIESDIYDSEQTYEMAAGDMVTIARVYCHAGFSSDLLNKNKDAYFNIYLMTDQDDVLVRSWSYENYDKEERSMFNPIFVSQHVLSDTEDMLEINYIFTILPEDLEREL